MSSAGTAGVVLGARRDPWLPVVVVVALALWASAFVGIRAAVAHYPPGSLALIRFLVAATCLSTYTASRGGFRTIRRASRGDWIAFAVLAFAGVVVYHLALNAGERTVSAGSASLLVNTTPVFTVVLATLFLGERLGVRGLFGLAVAFGGAALVSLGTGGGVGFEPGALWVLVAAVSQAVYFIVQKRMLGRYGALELTTVTICTGCAMLLPFLPQLVQTIRIAPASATAVAVYLGLGPSALAYLGWAYVVSRLSVSRAVSFLYLVPVLAFALGWVALGERPELLSIAGGVATIGGVSLVHRRRA